MKPNNKEHGELNTGKSTPVRFEFCTFVPFEARNDPESSPCYTIQDTSSINDGRLSSAEFCIFPNIPVSLLLGKLRMKV